MRCPRCSGPLESANGVCPRCANSSAETADLAPGASGDRPPSSAPRLRSGEVFAGRYLIVERAAEGGMGVVYKAHDNALDETVALKLLQPRLSSLPAYVARFKDEVRLARQITHPNVCRIHDLGQDGDVLYLSMEWVRGETLRQLMRHAGTLPMDRSLAIAEKVAAALQAAHGNGIVHRDLKPENVMIDDRGEVRVMDFGLAVESGAPEGGTPGTGASIAAGTPGYMAPEQRRRERVDQRADLFALGCILREMLGGPALDGPDSVLGILEPAARQRVRDLLATLTAEDPDRRYASAEAVVPVLRDLKETARQWSNPQRILRLLRRWRASLASGVAALLVVVVVLFALWRGAGSPAGPVPGPGRDGFQKAGAGPGGAIGGSGAGAYYQRGVEYLRDRAETPEGLSDAIQMLHRAAVADPRLAVAWAGLGEAYWTRFERTGEASSRDEADKAVREALRLDPRLKEARHARAIGLIVTGDFAAARRELEEIVRENPEFDPAWAALGRACQNLGDYASGLNALRTAIRLKPDYARYYLFLGGLFDHFAENNEAAEAYRKAVALKPDSTRAWNNLAAALMREGHFAEAIPALDRSIAIEERASARSNLGTAHYSLGHYDEAIVNYRRATELEPRQPIHWGNLGDALKMRDDPMAADAYREAARLARSIADSNPGDPRAHERLGLYCAKAGLTECALGEGSKAAAMQPENAEFLFTNAVIRCLLGRHEEAMDWLERAVKLGYSRAQIAIEPDLKPLREQPRFRRLVELAG